MKTLNFKDLTIQISEKNYIHQKNTPTDIRIKEGIYEKEEISLIKKSVTPNSKVLDLGASIGITSCVINRILENKSKMVVVEANPNLIDDLKNNRNINSLDFSIEHGAISYNKRKVRFNFNGLSLSGSIFKKSWLIGDKWGKYKNIELTTMTPMDLELKYNIKFDFLSCDIEGEEYVLLNELYDYFSNYKAMVVEFHEKCASLKINRNSIEKKYSKIFNIKRLGSSSLFTKK
tara:strand:- start:2790 stop:3485 length:696 start_codon:yes stop_codon:yes gene_type:complete